VAGAVVGWLPGLSTATANGVLAAVIRYDDDRRGYLLAASASNTANAFLGLGALYAISRTRNGVMAALALTELPPFTSLLLAGFLAVTGTPPFSPFWSEFVILNGALGNGRWVVGGLFLLFLAVIFVGMGATVLQVVQGDDRGAPGQPGFRDGWLTAGPPLALLLVVLALGLWLPARLQDLFSAAARLVAGT
jgi:hydrogenase-4 component F